MAGFQLRNLIKIRRAGDLSCPDCSVIMSPYRCGDVIIDKCESCDGIWFDHQEIGAFKKSLDQMDLSDLVGVFHPSESTDSHTIPICPRCQIPLYEGEYNYNSKVKVHRCERCRGVWLPLVQTLRLIDLARLSQAIAPHATGLAHEFEKADTEIRIYQNLERTGQQLMTRVHHHSSVVFALFGILVPLYDQNPRKSTPVVTIALILTNMLILQWMAWGDVPIRELYETFALQPSEIVRIDSLYTLFASCFMHAGLIHLLVNMYCLWLFGDNMEDILGARKYIALYLLSG